MGETVHRGLSAGYGVAPTGHPYYRFGSGERPLVVLTGVLDALGPWRDPGRVTRRLLADYYFRAYREFDVRVVARPPGLSSDADAASIAAGYADALAAVGPATVLGVSLGGAVGARLAAETDLVDRLVLVSCGAGLGPYGRQAVSRWRDLAAARRYRTLHLDFVRSVYAGWRRLVLPPLYRVGAHVLPEPAVQGDIERSCAAMLGFDGAVLSEVSVPTLVVGGRQDPLVPVGSQRGAARRLDAPLALLPGGHGVYEEQRSSVAEVVLRFLKGDLED